MENGVCSTHRWVSAVIQFVTVALCCKAFMLKHVLIVPSHGSSYLWYWGNNFTYFTNSIGGSATNPLTGNVSVLSLAGHKPVLCSAFHAYMSSGSGLGAKSYGAALAPYLYSTHACRLQYLRTKSARLFTPMAREWCTGHWAKEHSCTQ